MSLFTSDTHAASTSSYAGTVASADVSGNCTNATGDAWGTTLSAYQSDNNTYGTYGDNSFDGSEISPQLRLSNFHFAIPNGSSIDGITVDIYRKGTANDVFDYAVWLMATTTAHMGNNQALAVAGTNDWGTSEATVSYGGSADLWTATSTFSESTVEGSSFGVILCVQTGSGDINAVASVDLVQITVNYTVPTVALTQDGYRWRANHQGETGTTWLAAEDTVITGPGNTTASTTRLRILVDETASVATTTLYQLEYATSTSAGCSSLTYVAVADQASSTGYAWKMSPTSQFANGAASTNVASGLTDATGSFRAGVTQDTASRISSGIAHAAGEFTELEWSIEAIPRTHVTGQSYCFRVTNADDTTNFTYSAYPKINLATSSPALSQLHYRWRANHQSETGTTWLAVEDTPITGVYTASTTRLRMMFDETGGKTGTTTLYQLEYATSTISGYSGCSALSTWVAMPVTASSTSFAWIATSTAQLVNRGSTTNVASGLNDPSSGTFSAGQTLDRNSTTTPLQILDGNNFTEIEWTLEPRAQAEGDSYCFRVTNADSTTNITFSAYARASVATTTFTQANYRIYKNANNITPSTPWDGLAINQAMTSSSTSDRIGGGDEFRLRINVTPGTVDLPTNAHQFSLQYAELSSGTCSGLSAGTWKGVGAKDTSLEAFTFTDNLSVNNTATISDVTPLSSNVGGLYQEVQNTTANPNSALKGQTVEYDWALKYPYARFSSTSFCFRMTHSDGDSFATYTNYPRVLTNIMGAGANDTVGAPVGGGGAKGNATTTGGTQSGGGEVGGSPPAGNAKQSGGGQGGGGEVFIQFFRYFAGVLWGGVEFVVRVLRL